VPAGSVTGDIVYDAFPLLSATVLRTVEPAANVIDPVGVVPEAADTVAVIVADCPSVTCAGACNAVVVAATAPTTFMLTAVEVEALSDAVPA